MSNRIISYLEKFSILYNNQFGFMAFIEMQQYKGSGNKKFCNIHRRSSLDLVEWAGFGTID